MGREGKNLLAWRFLGLDAIASPTPKAEREFHPRWRRGAKLTEGATAAMVMNTEAPLRNTLRNYFNCCADLVT